jgi:hypothetical protein
MSFEFLVEKILNGLSKGKTIKDISKKHKVSLKQLKQQLKKGISVEKEHTKKTSVAKKIAMDHLFEDPKYYTKLSKME